MLILGLLCALLPAQPAPDPQQALKELLDADRAFSTQGAGLLVIESIPRMFAADVIVPAPGNRFADGRDNAIEAMRANPDNLTAKATWAPVRGGISADGQHGFTFGFMTLTRADGSTLPLKYLAYWIKGKDGWRVAAYKRRQRAAGDVSTAPMAPSLPARIVPKTTQASADVVESLKRAEAEFSATAQKIGIGEAFTQFGHADAMNMGGPDAAGFVIGSPEIGRSVGAGSAPGTSPVVWGADRAIVSPAGDLGITFGMIRSKEKPDAPGNPFFTIWRRADPSQPWKYIAE